MSARKDVIAVYYYSRDIYEALKKEFPDADVRDVVEYETEPSIWEVILKKVTPTELSAMQEADILILSSYTLRQIIYDLPKAKWIQDSGTGSDKFFLALEKDKPKPSYVLTRNISKDIGILMAEYVVGQIICHERSWYDCKENQSKKLYSRDDKFSQYRSLSQLTVGFLGMGSLALEVAKALKFFGCQVHGYTRSPKEPSERSPHVDEYWHSNQLPSILGCCDYIVSMLPSTPETRGFLDGGVLKHAKKQPVLINTGRGDLISEKELLKALDEGWISAAILDVFEKEPLPEESNLWSHPKIVMTPHVSAFGNITVRNKSLMDCFKTNYKRYKEGLPLLGLVDFEAGY